MTPTVRILATCRSAELLPYTRLVFSSIRVGFPTANIRVFGNGLPDYALIQIQAACAITNCSFVNHPATKHHLWIEKLISELSEPFILCDTDCIFYEPVEHWQFDTALAGARIPEWKDEFTNAITRSRLHPSLLFVDPVKYRESVVKYESQFPVTPFNPLINLVHPICQPFKQRAYFSDTMSLAYHAIGGTAFTDRQLDAYFHFHFGSCADEVLPKLTHGEAMKTWRQAVLDNPNLGRGAWQAQRLYWENHQPVYDGKDVVAPVTPEDAAVAKPWCAEICCGNPDAMIACDLFYGLAHGADDLIDSMEDGRPLMSKQQMCDLLFNEAVFYNCKFYVQNRDLLFPILLHINRTFADSLQWEKAAAPHLRHIADIDRMVGNNFYGAVALICGGLRHRDFIMRRLKEKDFLLQHDQSGNPI